MAIEQNHPDGDVAGEGSTADSTKPFRNRVDWRAGGFAGLVASVAMGVAITGTDVTVIGEAIAGLYGFEGSLVSGWIAHLVHGTVFGVVFAVVLSDPAFHRLTDWLWKTVLGAVVYGVVLAVFGAGLIMPVWLTLVGVDVALAVPAVSVSTVVWHLVYGLVLGVGYYGLAGGN